MNNKGPYRIEKPSKGLWEVWREGAKRPSSRHRTKGEAQAQARVFQNAQSRSGGTLPASAARKPAISTVLKNLELLSQKDLLQVAEKANSLARSGAVHPMKSRKSVAGIMADLGPPPTREDIEQARREMWGRVDKVAP